MYYFIDLENFKTQPRSAVNVREGQGVVLLCGTPMHSGGKADYSYIYTILQNCICMDIVYPITQTSYCRQPIIYYRYADCCLVVRNEK